MGTLPQSDLCLLLTFTRVCVRCVFTVLLLLLLCHVAGIVLTNDGHAILREIDVNHPAAKVSSLLQGRSAQQRQKQQQRQRPRPHHQQQQPRVCGSSSTDSAHAVCKAQNSNCTQLQVHLNSSTPTALASSGKKMHAAAAAAAVPLANSCRITSILCILAVVVQSLICQVGCRMSKFAAASPSLPNWDVVLLCILCCFCCAVHDPAESDAG